MKNFVSESREQYEDYYHGNFSKKLAQWAISNMKVKDKETGTLKKLKPREINEMNEILKTNKITIPEKYIYTAWYLFNMSFADYPETITTDEQRANFIQETILDPDCKPEAVLECFTAKMCCLQIPIFWEDFI